MHTGVPIITWPGQAMASRVSVTLHTYLHTYIHTYIHTYMQTCVPIITWPGQAMASRVAVSLHTYIHTYMHTGVPIITWPGQAMASRVAVSLLMAAGMEGTLIARTSEDYVNLIVTLAVKRKWREMLRRKIENLRYVCVYMYVCVCVGFEVRICMYV